VQLKLIRVFLIGEQCSDLVSKAVSLPLSKSEGPGQHPAASSGHEMQCQSGMLEQTIVEQEVAILKERIILRESQHECQCSSLEQTAAELRQEIINLKESHIKEISEAKKREWVTFLFANDSINDINLKFRFSQV